MIRQVPSRVRNCADRLDLFRRRFLLGHHVVEAEDHQRVRVGEHAFVDRQSLAGLIDPLEDSNRLPVASPTTFWKLTIDK